MSIWTKDGKLAPNSYEKTLIGACKIMSEKLIIWIEGSNINFETKGKDFGMCGGNINTNAGIEFTKEELQYIIKNMKEGSILRVAACNSLSISDVEEDFIKDNDMIQIGPYSFAPSGYAKTLPQYI